MNSPLVTVIMPTYNHESFVAQAIESVLNQTFSDYEFLIVDDGSSDHTRDVVSQYVDKRIKYWPNTTNQGACARMNEMLKLANGKYLALINSDDYWPLDKLDYQVNFLEHNPEHGAIFGRALFVNGNGNLIQKSDSFLGSVFDKDNLTRAQWLRSFFDFGNSLCHPTILIRKSCFNSLGFYNNYYRQLPDFDMWIRFVKKYSFYISDRHLIYYRILSGENASAPLQSNITRCINEYYLIARTFFDNVSEELLTEGFGDLLRHKNPPSKIHWDIEKTLLYFESCYPWNVTYFSIGIEKLFNLLMSEKYIPILEKDYNVNFSYFQKLTAETDIFLRQPLKHFSDNVLQYEKKIAETNLLAQQALQRLYVIENSSCWKATKMLRFLLDRLRK